MADAQFSGPNEDFRKMGEALSATGTKRTWAQQEFPKTPKGLEIKKIDMGNMNSFGDGETFKHF